MKLNLPKFLLKEFLDAQASQDEKIVTDGLSDSLTDIPKPIFSDNNYIKKVRKQQQKQQQQQQHIQQQQQHLQQKQIQQQQQNNNKRGGIGIYGYRDTGIKEYRDLGI